MPSLVPIPFMFKKLLVTALVYFICFITCVQAQEPIKPPADHLGPERLKNACASDMMRELLRKNKNFKQQEEQMNRQIINASRELNDSIITLPVVIHIVNPNPFSIPDAAVIAGRSEERRVGKECRSRSSM